MNKKELFLFVSISITALFFYTYNNSFGLPHSFYADEPEIAELAIKYTYELRSIIADNNYYKLIPISFVYGTVPVYFFSILTIIYSKLHGILGITFEKMDLYVFMRTITAFITLSIIPATYLIYKKLFKDNFGALLCCVLIAVNWKLIVHAHYVNADIVITALLTWATVTLLSYLSEEKDTKYTLLTGILLGLAIGTKVTAGLSLPVFLAAYWYKKDLKGFLALILTIFGSFAVTNPFSLIFIDRFVLRTLELQFKENGLVLDSIDTSPVKYLTALFYIATPLISLLGAYGLLSSLKTKKDYIPHYMLLTTILIYLVFYSLGPRRVDRWLLPLVPIMCIYGAYTIATLKPKLNKIAFITTLTVIFGANLYFPILLLGQFQRYTPKAQAYLWAQENLDPTTYKYVITEEGLDPFNKLPLTRVEQFKVYENEGALLSYPDNPFKYHYIILSSRPLENYKKTVVLNKAPNYAASWLEFEQTILNPQNFEFIQKFELSKPNLIPLSDVYIYKNLKEVKLPPYNNE